MLPLGCLKNLRFYHFLRETSASKTKLLLFHPMNRYRGRFVTAMLTR